MIDIYETPIVSPAKLYQALSISDKTGKKRLQELMNAGAISPMETGTGRYVLTFREAETFAAHYAK